MNRAEPNQKIFILILITRVSNDGFDDVEIGYFAVQKPNKVNNIFQRNNDIWCV